jgi:hypothetical protein
MNNQFQYHRTDQACTKNVRGVMIDPAGVEYPISERSYDCKIQSAIGAESFFKHVRLLDHLPQ